jgi:hypothetical protein
MHLQFYTKWKWLTLLLISSSALFGGSGIYQTYAIINKGSGNEYYAGGINSQGATAFNGLNLGSFCPTATLILNGGEVLTFKNSGSNVTGANIFYRIYPTGSPSGSFIQIDLPFYCEYFNNPIPCAGTNGSGDQKWTRFAHNVNMLSGLVAGNYTLEVYWNATTSSDGTHFDSNFGNNFKATFTVLPPALSAVVTPVSCFGGNNGAINLTASCVSGLPPMTQTYTQDFNSLASTPTSTNITWTDNSTIANWYTNRTLYRASTGTDGTGSVYSFGTNSDRALGSIASGTTGTILGAVKITNTTGQTITSVAVSYYGEQWRIGASSGTVANRLDFTYAINATDEAIGTYTDVNSLDFVGPYFSTGSTSTAIDGNNSSNRVLISSTIAVSIAPGSSIWLRWQDADEAGTDQGLAIDDLTVTLSSAAGGVGYAWTGPGGFTASTEDISGLAAGDYTVTITGGNGTATATYTVGQPTAISISEVVTNVSCNGGNNGAINISVSGGTGGYTFSWTNGATTEDISGLTAGNYTVTVTDGNGCKATKQIAVTQPPVLSLSTTKTDVSCNGGTNGSINLTVNGNTSPYSFAWSNGATSEDISSLSAGSYSVIVTDANGCTATTSVTINEPAAIVASYTASPILCKGGSSTVTIKATGGTAPYTGTGTFSQAAGTQTYTVTDANNCTASVSVTVTEPAELTLGTSKTDVSCNGGNTGAVNFTVTGGTPGVNITQNFNSLASSGTSSTVPTGWAFSESGTNENTLYTASTGSNNAGDTYSFGLASDPERAFGGLQSGSLTPFIGFSYTNNTGHTITSINVSYYGEQWRLGTTGRLDKLDFQYNLNATLGLETVSGWVDVDGLDFIAPVTTAPTGALNGNASANRTLVSGTITGLSIPNGATVWIAWKDYDASGAEDGLAIDDVSISYVTGTPHYSYLWSNGATTEDISGLTAGNYSVTVTDANGCTASTSVTITEPDVLVVTATPGTILCNGGTTSVVVSATGGTSAYTGTGTINNVGAGTYTYTVTDENGCSASTTITIGQPDAIVVTATPGTILCNGGTTSVTVGAVGGTGGYTGTGVISNVAAGTHTYTVTDANGCTGFATITIGQPDAIVVTATPGTILCNGGKTSVVVSATGGTGAYIGTGTITNVSAGAYTYSVTDENGCTGSTTITVGEPTSLSASSSATVLVCPTGTATVTVSANGGTAPYSGTGTFVRSAGTYTFVVTDANGCTASTTITITATNVAPVINSVTASTVAPIALGGSVSITTNYTDNNVVSASVNWDDGSANQTVSNPASTFIVSRTYANPGVYSVTITLTDGCGLTASYKYDYVVVYDPNGGFVTGGGWINSPAGAYVADASLSGKANFGFVAKYKKGTNVPDGNTEFQFHAGNFNFKSSAYDAGWLVISGYKATFRGTGTVNGAGNYGFLVSAIDGQKTGGGGYDKFRIKIWDKSNGNMVVYDNDMGLDENGLPTTAISGGSIVIHEVKKNTQTNTLPVFTGPTTDRFDVKVLGNPSTTKFTLKLESSNFNDKITLKIVDISGRIMEVKQNLYSGQVVEFGTDYKVGSYFVEAVQGDQRKVIKLIKASRD